MPRPPRRYAPRAALSSRASSFEVVRVDDFAATTLDRPVVHAFQIEAALAAVRQERTPARSRAAPTKWLPIVVVAAVLAGTVLGVALGLA